MIRMLLMVCLALLAGACGSDRGTAPLSVAAPATELPDPVGEPDRDADNSPDTFLSGIQNWQGMSWDDATYATVAGYDVFSYQAARLMDDPQATGLVDELREHQPDISVGGYIETHAVKEWQIAAYEDGRDSFAADWAEHALTYLAWTTEADTFRPFDRNYMIDITADGAVEGMVEIIGTRWRASGNDRPNMFLMLDYCSVPQVGWLTGRWAAETYGELDLDQDGIAHLDDPDEQEDLRAAYYRLVDLLHQELPGVQLISNGALAQTDPVFLAKLDGMYIEGGFRWGWGRDYFREALVSDGPRNLQTMLDAMQPDGFSIYEWKEDYRVGYAIGMFYDNLVPLMTPGADNIPFLVEPQPGEWDVGEALGPTVIEGDQMTREFERGTAVLNVLSGNSPGAFEFTLTRTDGSVFVNFTQVN